MSIRGSFLAGFVGNLARRFQFEEESCERSLRIAMARKSRDLRQRVVQAAEAVLKRDGSVGPLELLQDYLL